MTSMIDITFLLIAFFMVLINFTEADQNERVKLPVSELAKPPERPPTEPMVLQVLENGNIIYGNVEYDFEGFRKQLEFHIRFLKFTKVPVQSVTVILRGDARCDYGKIRDVIELCQKMEIENFQLRARQAEQ